MVRVATIRKTTKFNRVLRKWSTGRLRPSSLPGMVIRTAYHLHIIRTITSVARRIPDLLGFLPFVNKVIIIEPVHEISNNVVCATSKASDQPGHTRSLIRAVASRLSIL